MKKFYIFVSALLICTQYLAAQMVLKYKTVNPFTIIELPLNGTVDVAVDWGDGTAPEIFKTEGNKEHYFKVIGSYTVSISGKLSGFGSSYSIFQSYQNNLVSVESWDGLGLTSLRYAFYNSSKLISLPANLPSTVINIEGMLSSATSFNQPISTWNTINIISMAGLFYRAKSFNQPINNWNTSNVTNMSGMFSSATSFNQPIDNWNTVKLTKIDTMFSWATSFNQPIGNWNTANVTTMSYMFRDASSFNQPIGNWNTANVTDMSGMFYNANSFNQNIASWNTTKVTDMRFMFVGDSAFNQPIGNWNTHNVTRLDLMFAGATSFNQSIANWTVKNVITMRSMFMGAGLCTAYYDDLLNGWAAQVVKSAVDFDGGNSKYSTASTTARATLISKGWSITDAGPGIDDTKCPTLATEGEQENTTLQKIIIYPNPSTGLFNVSSKMSLSTIRIYNAVGSLVYEQQPNGMEQTINLSEAKSGLYLLKIGSQVVTLRRE